jgi:hypothetical protein
MGLIAVLAEAILVPFSLAFEKEPPAWSNWTTFCYWAVDILLNFTTGYFEDGVLMMKQDKICWHYLRTWLFVDVLATFPWFAITDGPQGEMVFRWMKGARVMRMLRLLRVAKLGKLAGQVEDVFNTTSLVMATKLLKIIAVITLVCHWVACLWAWLGHGDRFEPAEVHGSYERVECEPDGPCERGITGSPWRKRYGLENEPLLYQYLIALRFATGLFTGSDIGIQPGVWAERLFVILTMFLSFIALSSAISRIVVMFNKMSQDGSDQEELMLDIKEFMGSAGVPLALQAKVKRYLEYQYRSRKDLRIRHSELLERLSPWLRTELQAHVNKNILRQHPCFRSMARNLLAECCCVAEAVLCAPGDIVAQRGQNSSTMYFLLHGKLHISGDDIMLPTVTEHHEPGSKKAVSKRSLNLTRASIVEQIDISTGPTWRSLNSHRSPTVSTDRCRQASLTPRWKP